MRSTAGMRRGMTPEQLRERFPAGTRDAATWQRHVLTVDSRSRENPGDTTPANYTVKFPAISQVKQVRLVSSEIPNSQYVFHSRNNVLNLVDVGGTGNTHEVPITEGSYTALELANELNLQLNAAVGVGFGIEFVVTYITFTKKFRIERLAGGSFSLLFASGNSVSGLDEELANEVIQATAHNLGFNKDHTNVLLGASATSDTVVDLAGDNYVYLQIRGLPALVNTESIPDVFAKIIWNVPPAFITYDSFAANNLIFPNPIQLLSELQIKFVRQDGELYQFNGIEHSFSIEIFSTVQT
jgi:hypothetical protein